MKRLTSVDKFKRLVLIFPPMDEGNHIYERVNFSPPMGLLSIKNFINRSHPNVKVEIVDGMLEGKEALEKKLEDITPGELVGLSVTSGNADTAFKIAKIIKEKGAVVLAGGPHVS